MREEEKKRSSQIFKFKRFMKKRWVYPAIYIASAGLILTAVLWFQNGSNDTEQYNQEATDVPGKNVDEPAIEVNRSMENFSMPVKDPDSVIIKKQFYDDEASAEEQEAALVFYNNTYHPNTGIDIAAENGETFDVVASLSGKVTNVQEDQLLGNVIEIEHDKGIVTQYQSVTDIAVKVGDEVKQGDIIAKAGKSLYNKDAGVHLHFEIRKDNIPVDPNDYFNKPLSALQEANIQDEESDNSGKTDATEGTEDEESSADEQPAEDSDDMDEDDEKEDQSDTEQEDSDSSDA